MNAHRTLALTVVLTGAASAAAGQNGDASAVPERLRFLRDVERPNYVEEILPKGLQSISLPAPPVGAPPDVVRGIYMNGWTFGGSRFDGLLALADTTEINAFVIDVKDVTGYIAYRSAVPTAIEIGANGDIRVRDVRARLELLRERGIHPIARIVVAKDPLLAKGRPEWSIQHTDGGGWIDRFGDAWVDAYRDSVWIYAAELAREAVLMGFAELQFDYVRLPDERPENMATAVFPAQGPGESRRSGMRRNLRLLGDRVRAPNVPYTLDIFGLTTAAKGDMGIGQVWEDLVELADVVLPMVYPSHYYAGAYGLEWPNAEPYETVYRALDEAVKRNEGLEDPATIRPYLQSFSIRRVVYRAPEIRAQMRAVYDVGLTDWILWNASGRYPADAFLPKTVMTGLR